jgi:hypothetical protein
MIDRNDLHACADGELAEDKRTELLSTLESNPVAKAEYESICAMKQALKSSSNDLECNELWQRCRGRLDEVDQTKKVESFIGRYAWGICGVFFLAIALGGVLNRSTVKSVRSADVAGYVAGWTPSRMPRNQNAEAMEPFVQEVMGKTSSSRSMRLVAYGENQTPGRRSRILQFADAFGEISVVAFFDVQKVEGIWEYEPDPAFRYTKIEGVNALFWNREDGVICMILGNRSYKELHEIVQRMTNPVRN